MKLLYFQAPRRSGSRRRGAGEAGEISDPYVLDDRRGPLRGWSRGIDFYPLDLRTND